MTDPVQAFAEYEQLALTAINSAKNSAELEAVRIEFLGKKQGKLRDVQALLGKATPEERPVLGQKFNEIKERVTSRFEDRKGELDRPQAARSNFDLTLPGEAVPFGRLHPLTQTINDFKEIMGRFGFETVEGPELEDDWHNFEALNIPEDHPARDPLDNFYLATAGIGSGKPLLMRSQTSTVQIRTMEQRQPPIRIISVGRVYRPDDIDETHHQMFHQMEGLMIDVDVTMASLKTTLKLFAQSYLGPDATVRFRPSFFPFTEPSVEVDLWWGNRWLEIGGAGMVDPNVLNAVGYNPDVVTGFAFGLGIERFCMARHGIRDIRHFTQNDVRFLRQF